MKLVIVSIGSWCLAVTAYFSAFPGLVGAPMMDAHVGPIVRISALVVAIMVAIAYTPLMFALRSWNRSQGRWYVFPVAGIVPGLAPVLITGSWRIAQPYLAPAATSCLFVTFGIAFGTGFYLAYARPSTGPPAVEAGARSARGSFRVWVILPVAVTLLVGGLLARFCYTFYQPEWLFVSMHSQVRPGMSRLEVLTALARARGANSRLRIDFRPSYTLPRMYRWPSWTVIQPTPGQIEMADSQLEGVPTLTIAAFDDESTVSLEFAIELTRSGIVSSVGPAWRVGTYGARQLTRSP